MASLGNYGINFGGGSVPTFNPQPLENLVTQSQQRQQGIIQGLYNNLQPLTAQYGTNINQAGGNYAGATTAAAKAYQQGLAGLNTADQLAAQTAVDTAKRQAYSSLPGIQQSIRESLAATGNLKGGRAATALVQPSLQIAQNIQTLTNNLQQQGYTAQQARQEAGVQAIYSTAQGNALTQLGIDQDTARTLLQNGRSDLITQAGALAGLDATTLNQMLGLETEAQTSNIAAAQANQARQTAIGEALGTLGGAGIGAALGGGIPGATFGAKLGQATGSLF